MSKGVRIGATELSPLAPGGDELLFTVGGIVLVIAAIAAVAAFVVMRGRRRA
ncbi:hypothetical protein [Mumia sp. Pv 4-285]|uniref:hypothetical protein n=1 Tax=Mumia qirimensis TaxID=3234852 RepID=UPI00351CCE1F